MCDCYTPSRKPICSNTRYNAVKVFDNPDVHAEDPWYVIEQQYTLLQKDVKWPLGWTLGPRIPTNDAHYCSTGADKSFGRDIADAHFRACIYAGINITAINGEVMPGQWKFQVGPAAGISAGDQLWVARYILERITEIAGVVLSFDPKPIQGDWNGSGAFAHINYCTKSMRSDGYSPDNRHHGSSWAYETVNINNFPWGPENRGSWVRVGYGTEHDGKVYLEDMVPASNMDPYIVTSTIAATAILGKPT